jgi:hypothetical protein
MGRSIQVHCSQCGYSKDFDLGIGMMYGSLLNHETNESLLSSLFRSRKMRTEIKTLIKEKHASVDLSDFSSFGHEIFRCHKCHSLFNRFYLRLKHDDGIYSTEYKCPHCKVKLERLFDDILTPESFEEKQIDFKKYPCPKCGEYGLDEFDCCSLWD